MYGTHTRGFAAAVITGGLIGISGTSAALRPVPAEPAEQPRKAEPDALDAGRPGRSESAVRQIALPDGGGHGGRSLDVDFGGTPYSAQRATDALLPGSTGAVRADGRSMFGAGMPPAEPPAGYTPEAPARYGAEAPARYGAEAAAGAGYGADAAGYGADAAGYGVDLMGGPVRVGDSSPGLRAVPDPQESFRTGGHHAVDGSTARRSVADLVAATNGQPVVRTGGRRARPEQTGGFAGLRVVPDPEDADYQAVPDVPGSGGYLPSADLSGAGGYQPQGDPAAGLGLPPGPLGRPGQPALGSQPGFGARPDAPAQPAFGGPAQPGFGARPEAPAQPAFGSPAQPAFGGRPEAPAQPAFGGRPEAPAQPGHAGRPDIGFGGPIGARRPGAVPPVAAPGRPEQPAGARAVPESINVQEPGPFGAGPLGAAPAGARVPGGSPLTAVPPTGAGPDRRAESGGYGPLGPAEGSLGTGFGAYGEPGADVELGQRADAGRSGMFLDRSVESSLPTAAVLSQRFASDGLGGYRAVEPIELPVRTGRAEQFEGEQRLAEPRRAGHDAVQDAARAEHGSALGSLDSSTLFGSLSTR
jgi:hypothetical protein